MECISHKELLRVLIKTMKSTQLPKQKKHKTVYLNHRLTAGIDTLMRDSSMTMNNDIEVINWKSKNTQIAQFNFFFSPYKQIQNAFNYFKHFFLIEQTQNGLPISIQQRYPFFFFFLESKHKEQTNKILK